VSLSSEQRTKLQEVVSREKLHSASNVNVDVRVGVNLPQNVTVRPLPASIVSIVPQYRGYEYVVVDEEIVIVEPRTRRVVTVIERNGSPRSTGSVSSSTRISLDTREKQIIRERLRTSNAKRVSTEITLSEGVVLPETVTIVEFPETIVSEVPEISSYEYVMVGERIGVIEPQSRRVIEIID
jgi:hypothetical protein